MCSKKIQRIVCYSPRIQHRPLKTGERKSIKNGLPFPFRGLGLKALPTMRRADMSCAFVGVQGIVVVVLGVEVEVEVFDRARVS